MRSTLVGIDMSEPAWLAVVKLVGFAVVLTPIAVWLLAKAVHVSRRRGTIIEY